MPQVPALIGMTTADATTALANANLRVGATTPATSATIAKGNVSGVKPPAGTMVDEGSTVDLEESTGPAQVAVPALIGMTTADATTALANANLAVGATTQATSATIAKGNVTGVKPAAGTMVDAGSSVDLEESTGPIAGALPNVTVPSVNGLPQREAQSLLIAAGLTLGQTRVTGSRAVPVGDVISSTPPAGSVVSTRASIDLQVSSGVAFDFQANLSTLIFAGIGGVALLLMGIALYASNFLVRIGDVGIARGLITFLGRVDEFDQAKAGGEADD
jgi:eukaryotic-like serine/threonine-protein kinase